MAIDQEEAKSTLFGNSRNQTKANNRPKKEMAIEARKEPLSEPAKWETLDRVTVLLTEEQKDGLDKLARKLMKFRAKETRGNPDKERITANTFIRVLIDNLLERETGLPLEVVSSEEELKLWTSKLFK